MEQLTKREFEVMQLIEQGYNVNYIAKTLYLTEQTILNHLQHTYDKFLIESRGDFNRKLRAVYLFQKYKSEYYPQQKLNNIKKDLLKELDELSRKLNNLKFSLKNEEYEI